MLFSFDEFNVILGMDWLIVYDAVVCCKQKQIILKLPEESEVKFVIDFVPGTSLISITHYRMALKKLKELKAQLQELIDRGFIRLSSAPMFFMKNKDDTLRLSINYQHLNKVTISNKYLLH
ncbi:DNA/RNA polymerases superfamily protein [Gossypium australe]|uniref:DNA/RNA polymerases superfamily protein n=1 Tax=Gossypium australe TaxID=47621 RepID=A0A5B6UZT9_9ROSI|nr:DNA/RNA polymerases superfamily protein [Gossypium australe]